MWLHRIAGQFLLIIHAPGENVVDELFHIPKQTQAEAGIINSKRNSMKLGEIVSVKDELNRFPRTTYDHTLYSADELVIMEQNWARLVEAYKTKLLPERYRGVPEDHYGINFGTNNGAYQRSWMRQGYKMFGIEINDTMKELEAYGCQGIRASYYDMNAIGTGTFDFGIVDRAMFNANAVAQRRGARCADGRYFSEMRRVIKDGGALAGILYKNWTAQAFSELASLGHLTFIPTKAKAHPFLAFVVDFSRAPLAVPGLEETVARLGADAASPARVLDTMFYVLKAEGSALTALFLPTNEIVELSNVSGAWTVVSRVWWEDRKQEFFKDLVPRSEADQVYVKPQPKARPPVAAAKRPPLRKTLLARILPALLGRKNVPASKKRARAALS